MKRRSNVALIIIVLFPFLLTFLHAVSSNEEKKNIYRQARSAATEEEHLKWEFLERELHAKVNEQVSLIMVSIAKYTVALLGGGVGAYAGFKVSSCLPRLCKCIPIVSFIENILVLGGTTAIGGSLGFIIPVRLFNTVNSFIEHRLACVVFKKLLDNWPHNKDHIPECLHGDFERFSELRHLSENMHEFNVVVREFVKDLKDSF